MRNLVLFIVIGLLASCAPREKLIARGWKFMDIEFESVKDSAAQAFEVMAREQMKANISFSMEADSSYTIMQLKEGNATRGKWWFSQDKKQLFTKTDLGLTQSKVLKLNKKVLIYEAKDPSGQIIKMFCVPTGPAN